LNSFFHYDDFWVLAAADRIDIRSPRDLTQFLAPVNGFLLYRPVSTLLYFYLLHQFFGYDPAGYHAAQIAFHIFNALLVYGIADRLFLSHALALATALVYATAPGHAIAVCWMALFTVTGTAFFYFLALWVWMRLDSAWRVPITLTLFVVALLASEHAVSLPLVLTTAAIVLEPSPDWRRIAREQAIFYVIGASYVGAKLYYLRHWLPLDFPNPAGRAYVQAGYGISLNPLSVLRQLGQYVGFSIDCAYGLLGSEAWVLTVGCLLAGLSALSTGCVVAGRWTTRPLRVATFGLDMFVLALGPVLLLPAHLYSYYVGIAALGMALALVGFARLLPRLSVLGPWALVGALMVVHLVSTTTLVRRSEEFRFFDSFSLAAARWLFTMSVVAEHQRLDEVVVPQNGVTQMVFETGRAHEVFLCARYRVRMSDAIDAVESRPGRIIIPEPWLLPQPQGPGLWGWLRRGCPEKMVHD